MTLVAVPPPIWFPLWVPVIFPFWWCFVLFLLSRLGGWQTVAQRYPAGPGPTGGVTYRFRNGGFSKFGTDYRSCLNVTVAPEGLYVRPMFPFSICHAPILLPRSCVGAIVERRFLGLRALEVSCQVGQRTLRLYLPLEAGAALAPPQVPPPLPSGA